MFTCLACAGKPFLMRCRYQRLFGFGTAAHFLTGPGLAEGFRFLPPGLINNRTAEPLWSSGKIQPAVLIKGRHKQLTLCPANSRQACQTPDWAGGKKTKQNTKHTYTSHRRGFVIIAMMMIIIMTSAHSTSGGF